MIGQNKITSIYATLTNRRPSRGDTIVEVMVSLVIISMVMATVYAMSSRSLRTGGEAVQRTEAVGVAQGQIDLLINAKNSDANFANFQVSTPYCIGDDGRITDLSATATKMCTVTSGNSTYSYSVVYNPSTNVFTVTTQWRSPDAPSGIANINLYYKLAGTYKQAALSIKSGIPDTGVSANVVGTVDPNGYPTSNCYFRYDTQSNYSSGNPTVPCSTTVISSPMDVTGRITGLTQNTTYWFEICVINIQTVGTDTCSSSSSFTTLAYPGISLEAVSNEASSNANNVDLSAYIKPNGSVVTACDFWWGPVSGGVYTDHKNCIGLSGTSNVTVTANATPLFHDVKYMWKVVATNTGGTSSSATSLFFTPTYKTPNITTTAATLLTTTTAQLNGTIDPYGGNVNYYFQYGLTASYGTKNPVTPALTAGNGSRAVNVGITGLTAGTTYHFQLCGIGGSGATTCGLDLTFTTKSPPPTISSFTANTPASNSFGFSYPNGTTIYTNQGVPRTLKWTTTNATNCDASGTGWTATGIGANSSRAVTAYPVKTYILTCYNASGDTATTSFSFGYVSSSFILYDSYPYWAGYSYYQSYTETGVSGNGYPMPYVASQITFGNGIGSLCADLSSDGQFSSYTPMCGTNFCHTFWPGDPYGDFLGSVPFNNGGNGPSFNDHTYAAIAGKDCNGN